MDVGFKTLELKTRVEILLSEGRRTRRTELEESTECEGEVEKREPDKVVTGQEEG